MEEILKTFKKSGSSSPPRLTTTWLTDDLDWSLNLNDFELGLISDFISDGSSPDDETLAVSSVTNVEYSDLPQHRSKLPESSATVLALPAVRNAIDVSQSLNLKKRPCKKKGKDRRAPTTDKEGFPPSLPAMRYRGVTRQCGGRFGAKIKVTNSEKKSTTLWLGTYCTEEEAAMAFDRAAFKYRGSQTVLNFPDLIETYDDESPKIIPPRKGHRSRRVRKLRRWNHQEATTEEETDAHVKL